MTDFATIIVKLVRARVAIRAITPARTLEQTQNLTDTATTALTEAIALLKAAREAELADVVEVKFEDDGRPKPH